MRAPTLEQHLFTAGPKRVLALDGGGVRGIISLAYLERLEALLRARLYPDLVLADYFDLIGGTSTGAIIAAGLALGMPVAKLIDIYLEFAVGGFQRAFWHAYWAPRFRTGPLLAHIRSQVGQATIGSDALRTGLAIVAKRIDTGSVWVFHNHPNGHYFNAVGHHANAVPNRTLPLIDLLRASTAAPTFFAPMRIEVAPGIVGTFVDGSVSPHNNPALLLFLISTLRGYGFRWPVGAERLMLISLGTGHRPMVPERMPRASAPAATLAVTALRSVIDDCSWLAQTLLQFMGTSPAPWIIDSEIGTLAEDRLGPEPLLHYQRYNIELSQLWLEQELGTILTPREISTLTRMDRPAVVPRLLELARLAAVRQIDPDHFPHVFDM